MKDKDKAIQIGEVLAVMAEMYDKQMSSMLASEYLDALMPYDIEVIRAAAKWLSKNHTYSYMPRPAQFIDACKWQDSLRVYKMHKMLEVPQEKPCDPEYSKLLCRLTAKALRAGRTDMDKIVEEINETYSRKKKAKSLLPPVNGE